MPFFRWQGLNKFVRKELAYLLCSIQVACSVFAALWGDETRTKIPARRANGKWMSTYFPRFLGRARRSRGGLMESRLRRRCRGGPPPPTTTTPLALHMWWMVEALGLYADEAYLLCTMIVLFCLLLQQNWKTREHQWKRMFEFRLFEFSKHDRQSRHWGKLSFLSYGAQWLSYHWHRHIQNHSHFVCLRQLCTSFRQEKAVKTVQKYGVGTCGPRGFYGTMGKCVILWLRRRNNKSVWRVWKWLALCWSPLGSYSSPGMWKARSKKCIFFQMFIWIWKRKLHSLWTVKKLFCTPMGLLQLQVLFQLTRREAMWFSGEIKVCCSEMVCIKFVLLCSCQHWSCVWFIAATTGWISPYRKAY